MIDLYGHFTAQELRLLVDGADQISRSVKLDDKSRHLKVRKRKKLLEALCKGPVRDAKLEEITSAQWSMKYHANKVFDLVYEEANFPFHVRIYRGPSDFRLGVIPKADEPESDFLNRLREYIETLRVHEKQIVDAVTILSPPLRVSGKKIREFNVEQYIAKIKLDKLYSALEEVYVDALVTVVEVMQARAFTPMELDGLILDSGTRNRYISASRPEHLVDEVLPLTEAAHKYRNRLIILGDAGIGKTSALRHLMLYYANNRLETGQGPIPLFVSLGAYHQKEQKLNNLLAQALSMEIEEIETALQNEEWIFFFDGINEVPRDHQTECFREIRNLIQGSNYNYILSSRYEGYRKVIDATELEVQPLSDSQINDFAQKHVNRLRVVGSPKEWVKQLKGDIDLMRLARIPFYLVPILHALSSGEEIPKSKAQLIKCLIEIRLSREKEALRIRAKPENVVRILADLAYRMLYNGGYHSIHASTCKELVREKRQSLKNRGELLDEEGTTEDIFGGFLSSNLLERSGSGVCFTHPLIQSYFAAYELAQRPLGQLLQELPDLLEYYIWDEVMRDLVGMLSSEEAERLLIAVSESDIYFAAECFRHLREKAEGITVIEDRVLAVVDRHETSSCWRAVDALGQLRCERAVDRLMGLLSDPDAHVRSSAAHALGELRCERAVDRLLELLRDPAPLVGGSASWALGKLRCERAVDKLIERLSNPDARVRSEATDALRDLRCERAADRIIYLLSDPDAHVRWSAIFALGELEFERATDKLIELLNDPDIAVRTCAVTVLEKLRCGRAVDRLIGLLSDPDAHVRSSAAHALGELRCERAVDRLLELLRDPAPLVGGSASWALGKLRCERAVDKLIELLSDPNANVRLRAAAALMDLQCERAADKLIELLSDPDAHVRDSVAFALGELGCERAADKLIDLLNDPDVSVRGCAAISLGELRCGRAADRLIELLGNPDAGIRYGAAFALGELRCERAAGRLIELLNDPDGFVRGNAAEALGKIQCGLAADRLIELLSDSYSHVRLYAGAALAELRCERAADRLIELLGNPDADIRESAAFALGEIGEAVDEPWKLNTARKLKRKFNRLRSPEKKGYLLDGITNFRNSANRRFLKILGPNF